MTDPLTLTMRRTNTAVRKYGFYNCVRAYLRNVRYGEGASTIALTMNSAGRINTTQQADAAIRAGREIARDSIARAEQLLNNAAA